MRLNNCSSPYRLDSKLKNIMVRNNTKSMSVEFNNNLIKSVPSLINHFCNLNNKVKVLKYYSNKIPLLPNNAEFSNDYYTITQFKSTNRMNKNNYNYLSTDFATQSLDLKESTNNIKIISNKKNINANNKNNRKIRNYSTTFENNFNQKHIRNISSLRNNDLKNKNFTFKNNIIKERKNKGKLVKLNKNIRNKGAIINHMRNFISKTLEKLDKTDREILILQNKIKNVIKRK